MTQLEYEEILATIETVENQEKAYCARYIELNPGDKARREHDAGILLPGMISLRHELDRRFKNRIA